MALALAAAQLVSLTGPVAAQPAAARAYSFNIPSKPLLAALADFTAVTGIQVVRPSAERLSSRSPAVSGMMSPGEALSRLLADSGLTYRSTGPATMTIQRAGEGTTAGSAFSASGDLVQLNTLEVRSETAWGPASGYVARRSASGSKTDTPLIETPQTVNVVTAEEMKARQPRGLAEAIGYTPGVVSEFQPHTTYFDRTRIRGFYSVNNVYLDGLQLTPAGTAGVAQIDPVHLERAEILKGPASVLYGQNGTGGLINMVSKRPSTETHREIGVTIGNKKLGEAYFDIGGPVTQDGSLLYRVTGVGRKADTDIRGAQIERWSIAPSVTWQPNAATSLTIMSGYQRDPKGNSGAYHPIVGTVLPNVNGRVPRGLNTSDPSFAAYDREQAYVGSVFEHKFNDALTFRQTARLMHVDAVYNALRLGTMRANQRDFSRTAERSSASTFGASLDNNLIYKYTIGPVRNETLIGFDYRYFRSRNWSESGTSAALDMNIFAPRYGNLAIPAMAARTNNKVALTQYGLYAQNQMSVGNLRAIVGLRRDWTKSDTQNYLNRTTVTSDSQALTGRGGLVYLFDNGLAPYFSYSTSFEPTSGTDYFGAPFKPTTGQQWEGGLRYQPVGWNAAFSLSAYQLTRQNVSTPDNAHSCAVAPRLANCGNYSIQTGEVRVRGIEFETKLSLAEGLNATFGYAYMDAKVTKSNDVDLGKRPTNAPRHMGSAWLSYTFGQGPVAGLTLAAGTRFNGSMFADSVNRNRIPAYALVDAMASYELGSLSPRLDGATLQVNATNLFDRQAVGGCWSANYCDYVVGRTVTASLRYRF